MDCERKEQSYLTYIFGELQTLVNVGIFINTPAQFHFYRNIAKKLLANGNGVMMLFRSYGETLELARELGFNPVIFATRTANATQKMISLPYDVINAARLLRRFKPDLITGFGSYESYTSFLLRSKAIVFTDSEPRTHQLLALQYRLFMPFTDAVITPSSFLDELGKKQIKINSLKELAYLHHNYFTPRDDVFDLLGLSKEDDYALIRFNAFDAAHDVQVSGFNDEQRVELVEKLSRHANVFVSCEGRIPKRIEKYALKIPKSRIHDVLCYAKLLVSDAGTMVTEAACLGTPAIMAHKNALKFGNFLELRTNAFAYIYENPNVAIEKAVELFTMENTKKEWQKKREKFLNKKIDITSFMVWFFENYPGSFKEMKRNPEIQSKFN